MILKRPIIATLFVLFFYNGNTQQLTSSREKAHSCGYNADLLVSSTDTSVIRQLSTTFNSNLRSFPITCGRFRLVFEDAVLGNGIGFDDPTNGIAYQNCVCDAFAYIQSIFTIPTGDGSPIEILINQSWSSTVNPLPSGMDPFILATGGPLYSSNSFVAGTPGFYGGNVFDHMLSGNDPDPSAIDGQITVNFDTPFHLCGQANCGTFDFYSVILHEITHVMGWGSAIGENSSTLLPESIFGNNRYSMYDKYFVYYGDIQTGPLTHVVNALNSSAPFIDPTIPANPFISNKIWMDGTLQYDTVLNPNNPLTSGPYTLTNSYAPNTISHFCDYQEGFHAMSSLSPGFIQDYSMGPTFWIGQARSKYSLQELRALNKMGYSFTPSFLAASDINPAVTNALLIPNHSPFTTKMIFGGDWEYTGPFLVSEMDINSYTPAEYTINNCASATIDLGTDNRLKDADGDPIRIFPGTLYNIRGCGIGGNNHDALSVSSGVAGDIITYTPRTDFIGRAQFGFNLYDGKEKGAFMVYTIDVTGCQPCASNLVVNGDFEEGSETMTTTHITNLNSSRNYYRNTQYNTTLCKILPDGQIYTNNGSSVVRSALGCIDTLTSFGFSMFSFNPGDGPLANPVNYGDRYFKLYDAVNYFRLCSSPVQCTSYLLEFDYNSAANYTVGFGFKATPVPGSAGALVSTVTTSLVNTAGNWQHVSLPINYCSATSCNFLAAVLPVYNSVYIDNIRLYVDPSPPVFSLNIFPDSVSTNPGIPVTLTAVTNNPLCATSYTWTPGLQHSSSINISPSSTNTYSVTVSDGCTTLTDQAYVNVTPTGLNDIASGIADLNVYPTPGNGAFFLDMEVVQKTNLLIEIENMLGQVVYTKTIYNAFGKLSELLDSRGSANGVYLLKIKTDHSGIIRKIVIE